MIPGGEDSQVLFRKPPCFYCSTQGRSRSPIRDTSLFLRLHVGTINMSESKGVGGEWGIEGGLTNERTGKWSCDLRAKERPKKMHGEWTSDGQTTDRRRYMPTLWHTRPRVQSLWKTYNFSCCKLTQRNFSSSVHLVSVLWVGAAPPWRFCRSAHVQTQAPCSWGLLLPKGAAEVFLKYTGCYVNILICCWGCCSIWFGY